MLLVNNKGDRVLYRGDRTILLTDGWTGAGAGQHEANFTVTA
jgi:hypothetical protein